VSHSSRSSGLLHVEVSQVRVFQSDLKAGGGATQMVHVASSWRLRIKLKMDGSMQRPTSDPTTITLSFLMY
jgi:hypothetical protein